MNRVSALHLCLLRYFPAVLFVILTAYVLNIIYGSQQALSSTMPSFPSYEEVRTSDPSARFLPIRLTPEAHRIFWTLQGPLASAISVMPEDWREKGSEPGEAYMQGNTPTDNSGAPTALHPIAAAPLTEPKISSITVTVYALDMWEQQWLESHEAHAAPTRPDCQFGELPPDYEGDERRDESDVDSDDEEDQGELLRCCEEDRPTTKWKLTVTPSTDPAAGGGCFVTVHDYVSAVHPWLMGLRGEIARADNVWDGNPPEYYDRMFVEHQAPDQLMTTNEASYISGPRAGRPAVPNGAGPTYLEQLVAKAETGDLEAAQQALVQAAIQRVPHGMSPEIMQTLRDKRERAARADYEKGLRQVFENYKRLDPDRSDEEIEEDMADIREAMRESLAKTIESIRVHTI
ncbi:hypothetical protein PG991_002964 [Apiospora marii]|uniref:Uncharacterized protein n=1 Tax=Apiospora marii TaxID=335849 RepID=A0ABR1SGV8_9PEZI